MTYANRNRAVFRDPDPRIGEEVEFIEDFGALELPYSLSIGARGFDTLLTLQNGRRYRITRLPEPEPRRANFF